MSRGKQNMQKITGGLILTNYLLLSNRCYTLLLTGLWVKMLLHTKFNVTFSQVLQVGPQVPIERVR
jgi:hypothetical protein